MIGFIYKITNDINDKVYIGQTRTTIQKRWKSHLARFSSGATYGIYGAMHKYGIQHFKIEPLLVCEIDELNQQEKYYIQLYNSYYNGYNLTLGGEGNSFVDVDEQLLIDKYLELGYITDTAKYFNCCEPVISNILHKNNIPIKALPKFSIINVPRSPKSDIARAKRIKIIELNLIFNSILECGKWLIENNYCKTTNPILAQKSISRVLNGDRQSYCKLHFEYL